MAFIKRVIKKLIGSGKLRIQVKKAENKPVFETEEAYYEWVFTQNENWNKATPNTDEQQRWEGIKSLIQKIEAPAEGTLKILDLGCGRGWLTNLLSGFGEVKGVEPVAPVVKYANELFPGLDIINADSDKLLQNGYEGSFDLVVSSEVLEHVPEEHKNKFALNINLLLKENGFAIISTPRKEAQEEYCINSSLTQPVEEWLSEKDVEQLFINQSFSVQDFMRLTRHTSENTTLDIYQLWLFKKLQKKSF